MVTLNTDGLSPKQARMVITAIQLRKESADENQETKDASEWQKIIHIMTADRKDKGITMAKKIDTKETKAAKTVNVAKTGKGAKTPGAKAAARVPKWKEEQEKVDASVAKGIKMLREGREGKGRKTPASTPPPAAPAATPAPTDKGHRDILRMQTIKPQGYGTYYPQFEPNGIPCLVIKQTESGRWLILDLSSKSLSTSVENAGGGSYYFTLEARFRTVDGSKLSMFTAWIQKDQKEAYQAMKPVYMMWASSIDTSKQAAHAAKVTGKGVKAS